MREWKQKMLLLAICFICHGNTISNEYGLDDNFAVTENAFVKEGIRGIPDLLTNQYYIFREQKQGYMPVPGILLAIEYQLFALNPHVSHAVNILLFGLLVLLIFSVLNSVFNIGRIHPFLPFIIAALYAVHPAFTEVVASIKNRNEILSLIFALLALRAAHRFFYASSSLLATGFIAVFFLALSFLSKMVSTPFAAIIVMMGLFYGIGNKKAFFSFAAGMLLFTFGFVAVTFSILNWPTSFIENPLVQMTDAGSNLALFSESLLFYFKFMLVPWPHRFYYGYNMIPVLPVSHPVVLFSLLLHLAVLIGGILLFRRKQLAGFFMLAYLGNIFIFCNKEYAGIVGERVLFIPGLWFIAAFTLSVYHVGGFNREQKQHTIFQKLIIGCMILVFFTGCGFSVYRNFQWKNHYTLMTADIPYLNNSAMANTIYGRELVFEAKKKSGNVREDLIVLAKKHFKRAVEIHDASFDPNFQLGSIYEYEEQNRDSAFYFFLKAFKINPNSPIAQFQLAKQYFLQGKNDTAEWLFSNLYQTLPDDTLTLFFYTQVLHNQHKPNEAFEINAALLKLAPETYYPYYNEGMMQHMQLDTLQAESNLEKAVQFGYRGNDVFQILSGYYTAGEQQHKQEELDKIFER